MAEVKKETFVPAGAPKGSRDHARNMAAMASRLGIDTVPAAWPTGVSHLALVVNTCQHCGAFDVCSDWLARAPNKISNPPAFCPNAPEFSRVKKMQR